MLNESVKITLVECPTYWIAELVTIDRRVEITVTGIGYRETAAIADAREELQRLDEKIAKS